MHTTRTPLGMALQQVSCPLKVGMVDTLLQPENLRVQGRLQAFWMIWQESCLLKVEMVDMLLRAEKMAVQGGCRLFGCFGSGRWKSYCGSILWEWSCGRRLAH